MFIERSTAKIRGVRLLFVLAGLLPCVALAGWAVIRHSPARRDAFCRRAEMSLGLPVAVAAVEHVRPGAVRLRECTITAPGGGELAVPVVEVETSADEVRIRIPAVSCGPTAAGALSAVARAWLEEPVRFPLNWIVEIADFSWEIGDRGTISPTATSRGEAPAFPLRIECVAAGDARAVRVHRIDRDGDRDEVRVIVTSETPRRYDVRGAISTPVPWSVVAAVLSSTVASELPLGADCSLVGTIEAKADGPEWSFTCHGALEGVDLAVLCAAGRHRLEGLMTVVIDRFEWESGRLVALEARGSAVRGRIAQSLLGGLVTSCGCRPGPAFRSLDGKPMRPFDELDVEVGIDGRGVRLSAAEGRSGALARRQGLALVDEPSSTVPLDRLAWLIAPTDAPAMPASAASAWLMRLLPPPETQGRQDGF